MSVPFVIGQWVRGKRFYGRELLIEEILGGPRNAVWLLGTRRVGKTSMLKQLELLCSASPGRGYFPLFWDFQGADDPEELHAGFRDALFDAEERLESVGLSPGELEADDLFVGMARLRRKLRARKLTLLLLCDEVEELVRLHEKNPALLSKFRHALQASGEVRSVLASTLRLWALAGQREDTSPFLHGFIPPLYVNALADEEARALVLQTNLDPGSRPQIDPESARRICERCDNHPYLLQVVAKRYLEVGDLDEASEQVAADRMVGHFFSVDFEMLGPVERHVLRTAARQTSAASVSLEAALAIDRAALQVVLQNLGNLGFIRRDGKHRVVLANYFFRRWLTDLTPSTGAPVSGAPAWSAGTPGGPEATTLDLPATVVEGRYELRRRVGEGATGVVYEAYDRLLETRMAVKLLRAEYAGNRVVLERFRKEILLSRDLGHPNILRVYHLGQVDDRFYLTMRWVEGPTLARVIGNEAPLPAERVAFLGARLASALEAAHGHKVLHRDIKPQNIMLEASGEPVLADFGLARLLGGSGMTSAGAFLGTPNYVSPEQAAMRPLDARSDLYSLGVVLFEMATGKRPFQAESAGEVLEMQRRLAAPDPRELVSDLIPELAAIILRCLEKQPGRRLQSAEALRLGLERLLPGGRAPEHPGGVVSDAAGSPARSPARSTPAVVAAGAAGGALAEDLLPLVYDELRRLARRLLARDRPGHTLQPTALVHEAYLRLARPGAGEWASRSHFFAVGARVMRHLLVDHARTRDRLKRGGDLHKVTLQEAVTALGRADFGFDELLAVDRALDELAAVDERQAQIVELRFFGGMTVEEVAEHLGLSRRTIQADWAAARAWLKARLS